MDFQDVTEKIRRLVEPVIGERGLELVDLELRLEGRTRVLRVFIDKSGGVTLDDCVEVSRDIDPILDVEDLISSTYRLEVSSPGLDRPLKKPGDFLKFKGERVKVKTRDKCDPDQRGHARKTFFGRLIGLEDDHVLVEQLDRKGGVVRLPLENIDQARLDPEF